PLPPSQNTHESRAFLYLAQNVSVFSLLWLCTLSCAQQQSQLSTSPYSPCSGSVLFLLHNSLATNIHMEHKRPYPHACKHTIIAANRRAIVQLMEVGGRINPPLWALSTIPVEQEEQMERCSVEHQIEDREKFSRRTRERRHCGQPRRWRRLCRSPRRPSR
ncbi:unnamed protein product, partial [Ectocarpus sp. 8 AP-2014]